MAEKQEEKSISLKSQSAWLLFAKTVGFAISFLLPLLVVRYLSQDEVGLYRQVFLVIVSANTILPLGFGMSAFYFLSRETVRRPAVVLNTLLFNFAIGGIAFLALYFYPQLLGNIFQSAEMTRLAPLIGIVIWIWIFSAFLEIVAVANQEARLATFFIIFAQLTKTLLMTAAVMIFSTVESFVYAAMVQSILQTIALLAYLHFRFPGFWTSFDAPFFREQLFYALPFGLSGLIWALQNDVHNYFVGYRFSEAEFAIYAFGCFQIPLMGMLFESVNAILIPRMSQLEAQNDKTEMLRLTIRAMQKLAFFCFPVYIFLLITAQTFITTLFTQNYQASVPIFMINLTLLPLYVLVTDPITRAYKELGRLLLIMRVSILILLIAALYFGIQYLDLRGMILIVVVTAVIDRFVSSAMALKKINFGIGDLFLLKDIGKLAVASLIAGVFTFLFYYQVNETIFKWGTSVMLTFFSTTKQGLIGFGAGVFVLGFCALIFVPIYLASANFFGLIEDEEKEKVKKIFDRIILGSRTANETNN